MKKTLLFLVLGIGLLLSGCFQIHRTIFLEKNGSGKLVQKVLFYSYFVMGTEAENYDAEKLTREAPNYGEGVRYVSSEKATDGDMTGYEVTYAFDDISKLKLSTDPGSDLFSMGVGDDKEYITFLFKKGKVAELTVIMPRENVSEDETEPVEPEDDEGVFDDEDNWDMTKNLFLQMRLSTRIIVKGKITGSDADHVHNNEVILEELDFGEMMKDEEVERKMKKQQNNLDIKSFEEKVKGCILESKEKITIKFN